MYFYHEGYDAYYTGAALEDLRARDQRDGDAADEPIRTPAILNWLVIMSVALCLIFAAIHALS